MKDLLAEFIGWNLSVGIYRCRAEWAVKILKFEASASALRAA